MSQMALFKCSFVIVLNQLNDIAKIEQANEIKGRVIITLSKYLGILNPKFLCLPRSRGHWHYNIFFCPLWVTAVKSMLSLKVTCS